MQFSVVIPTFNRATVLKQTIEALARQDFDPDEFEVLVVDDGSQDDTPELLHGLNDALPIRLQAFRQDNRKQGAARNLGARNAGGKHLLFLGDDIVPASDFLKSHRKTHLRYRDVHLPEKLVSVGYTRWPDSFQVTRFLRFIGEEGWQFGYGLIDDPEDLPFNFLYTSNVSLSRSFFLECGGFDEDFQEYGWEDIELGIRVKRAGGRIVLARDALAYHHHAMGLASFIERQKKVGYSAWKFYQKHPELSDFLNTRRIPYYTWLDHLKWKALTWACRMTEYRNRPDLSHFYPDLMSYYYNLGLLQAMEE